MTSPSTPNPFKPWVVATGTGLTSLVLPPLLGLCADAVFPMSGGSGSGNIVIDWATVGILAGLKFAPIVLGVSFVVAALVTVSRRDTRS